MSKTIFWKKNISNTTQSIQNVVYSLIVLNIADLFDESEMIKTYLWKNKRLNRLIRWIKNGPVFLKLQILVEVSLNFMGCE